MARIRVKELCSSALGMPFVACINLQDTARETNQNIGMVMSLPKLRRGGIITLSTTGLSPRMSAMTIDVKS